MLGKLLIPLAIGGGFLLLMSASAAPQSATYDALPMPLRQAVVQAHATRDPAMFDLVAAQLEAQGYPEQARLLRSQGEQLRALGQRAAPVVASSRF